MQRPQWDFERYRHRNGRKLQAYGSRPAYASPISGYYFHRREKTTTWTGLGSIVLSDVVDAAWCKTQATALLASIAVTSLTLGVDAKEVNYDPVWTGSGVDLTAQAAGWLMLGVWDDGITGYKWGWGSAASGGLYTSDGVNGSATFDPFENVTPAMSTYPDSTFVPPQPGSESFYEQEARWNMRKSIKQHGQVQSAARMTLLTRPRPHHPRSAR